MQFAINVEERSTDVAAEGGGGVLADEMGLGKTLQCIALIIARPAPRDVSAPGRLQACKASLVVVPDSPNTNASTDQQRHQAAAGFMATA